MGHFQIILLILIFLISYIIITLMTYFVMKKYVQIGVRRGLIPTVKEVLLIFIPIINVISLVILVYVLYDEKELFTTKDTSKFFGIKDD